MHWSYAKSVLAIVSVAWAVNHLSRWVIPPLLPRLQEAYEIGPALAGAAFTLLWIAYGIIQLVAGTLSDRFGAKAVLVPAMLALSVGMLSVSSAPTIFVLVLAFLLIGLGAGSVLSVSSSLISKVFPRADKAMAGFFAIGTSGAAVAPILALAIMNVLSWRWVFISYSIVALAIATLIGKVIKSDRTTLRRTEGPRAKRVPLFDKSILAMAVASSVFGYAWNGALTFLPSLLEARGLGKEIAATSYSISFASGVAMLIVGGWVSSRVSPYIVTSILSLMGGLFFAAIISIADATLVLILAVPLGIALHGFWGPAMTAILNLAPKESKGAVMGSASTMIALIEGTSPAFVGFLAEKTSLMSAMQVLIIFFFIAIVPLMLSRRLGERRLVEVTVAHS